MAVQRSGTLSLRHAEQARQFQIRVGTPTRKTIETTD
jgi:hypothetical protein